MGPAGNRLGAGARGAVRERLGLVALALCAVLAWALFPTYPDYDAYHHLVWGRDLLAGATPGFEDYAAPTQHPLYLALGALLSLAGEHGDRLLVLVSILSLVALTAGAYALGKALFGTVVGVAGALFVGSSFAFALYAVRAFVDVPFLALVVWAAALEARRPRRGVLPLTLLAAAGLLRPEAWVLAGLYWLWCLPGRALRERAALLVLVAAAPVLWALVDLAVTGDPLFSLHATSDLAQSLERERGLRNVPASFVTFLADLARPPVALAGVVGFVLALRRFGPRWMAVPLALAGTGGFTFVAIGIAGLSLIPRYLTMPAVALCVLAGYAVLGFTTLEPGAARERWRRLATGALAAGIAFLAVKAASFARLYDELRFIDRTHDELAGLLAEPRVRAGMRCGALTFPTYRLVPDARWQLEAGADAVHTRAGARPPGAVAVYITGDEKFERRFGRADGVSRATNRPPAGQTSVVHGPFAARVVCGPRER
jgi:Dolichyl-phosphate-mannose-protein mannosyltransferase